MENLSFNEKWRRRTKKLSVDLIKMYSKMKKTDETRIIGKQLLRSATSVAANFRAYCRGRSQREQFAKLCIVVEEADETLFWLEILEDTGLCTTATLEPFKAEALEILKMMSSTRKRLKN
ncbi:four helix bundle protein [Phaeodactylibacter xiamenensis]|uniref:four helix bundle protein n=1 Tax=Phaeodactylibacter xiamenensis TaxID=1524460 RepID=UPI0024A81206|nr:four helix bundle protein [Phaeodactylibacter xiamenensis]